MFITIFLISTDMYLRTNVPFQYTISGDREQVFLLYYKDFFEQICSDVQFISPPEEVGEFLLHLLKKSLAPPREYSGYEYELYHVRKQQNASNRRPVGLRPAGRFLSIFADCHFRQKIRWKRRRSADQGQHRPLTTDRIILLTPHGKGVRR